MRLSPEKTIFKNIFLFWFSSVGCFRVCRSDLPTKPTFLLVHLPKKTEGLSSHSASLRVPDLLSVSETLYVQSDITGRQPTPYTLKAAYPPSTCNRSTFFTSSIKVQLQLVSVLPNTGRSEPEDQILNRVMYWTPIGLPSSRWEPTGDFNTVSRTQYRVTYQRSRSFHINQKLPRQITM